MAPGSNERRPPPPPPHTGTVPKTKVRNCVVPQEAVTPTRRDINSSANLVSTSLDWAPEPVLEYSARGNYAQSSRNNNRADQDFSDLDNSLSLESALHRFVPVRPQPRGLPLPMQPPDGPHSEDGPHHYQPAQATSIAVANGVSPHANHGSAAVMIVNPTTPNTVTGNMNHSFNVPANTNRNNLTRTLHPTRNSSEPAGPGQPPAPAHPRTTKSNNLTSNVYEPNAPGDAAHGSLGEAAAVCPDSASVERRLGQIREYIRVTSSLVDTMRNSEDEAYIEHTKEEYDELVEMVMKLKESEMKLVKILDGSAPDNNEVLTEDDEDAPTPPGPDRSSSTNPFVQEFGAGKAISEYDNQLSETNDNSATVDSAQETENQVKLNREFAISSNNLVKKISNVENEQLNKSNDKLNQREPSASPEVVSTQTIFYDVTNTDNDFESSKCLALNDSAQDECKNDSNSSVNEIIEDAKPSKHDVDETNEDPNELLRKNIMSCNEKLAAIEVLREAEQREVERHQLQEGGERAGRYCRLLDRLALAGADPCTNNLPQAPTNNYHEAVGGRPVSAQSNGSAYSDNELWQNELKAKMEVSQQRLAALQDQQKRLLKYQAEAKQQLAEMHSANRHRQSQENLLQPTATSSLHHHQQGQVFTAHQMQASRPYHANQVGVATTLPHAVHSHHHHHTNGQLNVSSGGAGGAADAYRPAEAYRVAGGSEHGEPARASLHHENAHMMTHASEGAGRAEGASDEEEELENAARREGEGEGEGEGEELLSEHGRELQRKLRDLQRKKQHMENLVVEFQKLQAAERDAAAAATRGGAGRGGAAERGGAGAGRNTYCSSPDDSGEDEPRPHKCNKAEANMKNEDPFKLMEISAIKAALQKTKDLMRRVEHYEPADSHEDSFLGSSQSNINDNKSEGSVRSIHNSIQPAGKLTNQHAGAHDAGVASLQMLAQQMRQEAESIAQERRRLKHSLSHHKEGGGKFSQKRVNVGGAGGAGGGGGTAGGAAAGRSSPGPLERQQAALRAELAEKQRQLEMILNKEKELSGSGEVQKVNADSCSYSAMHQSYNSEQEEGDSRVEEGMFPMHPHLMYRSAEGSMYGEGAAAAGSGAGSALPPHLQQHAYCSDSDTGSRGKSSPQSGRSRRNRPPPSEHPAHQHGAEGSGRGSVAEPRPPSVAALPPHAAHTGESSSSTTPYPVPPPLPPAGAPAHHAWSNKSNQDARTNQFTQNSHSQTMERLLGQQLPFPPSVPFNMMMPYGMVGGGTCGCSWWGPWCWQQLTAQQREIHQLREQLNSLEERWRAESAPHALNNQVAPGNRANNYWDNFRSYSRQNLLSANSKTNADGHLGSLPPHNPHPLVERSHNTLHPSAVGPAAPPPSNTPKRNLSRRPAAPAAPDVLNVNRRAGPEPLEPNCHNLNTKRKSSSKLPAKNSSNRRSGGLHLLQNANINIVGASEAPDPNLASTSRDDKATSKLFDLLRENVYSEVTALISANESHPHFLIQLFRELQLVSSDALRRHALQSIRDVLYRAAPAPDSAVHEISSTNNHPDIARDDTALVYRDIVDFMIARGEEICSPDILEMFQSIIVRSQRESGQPMPFPQTRLQEFLSKYEGLRLRDVSGDIIDNLSALFAASAEHEEPSRQPSDASESSTLQDVAGSLNIYNSDSQLHQLELNGCAYDPWPPHARAEAAAGGGGEAEEAAEGRGGQDAKVDLIECAEMYNGDLAEADQACPGEAEALAAADAPEMLPDLVDTEEATPTEAEAEWLGLDRVPTRLHTAADDSPANQKD